MTQKTLLVTGGAGFIGTNFIRKLPKVDSSGKYTTYKFKCKIVPNVARLANGKEVGMKVSDDHTIRTFTIGVDPRDNCVAFVYLGPDQYHCDLDPMSKCLCIQNLLHDPLDGLFMERIYKLMITWDIEDSYRYDHLDHPVWVKENQQILKAI